jgi:hypothetical protein
MIIADSGMCIIDFGIATTEGCSFRGFFGTEEFASTNALQGRDPQFSDDVESLCYSLYALEIGYQQWRKLTESGRGRPTLKTLRRKSAIVNLMDIVPQKESKVKRNTSETCTV